MPHGERARAMSTAKVFFMPVSFDVRGRVALCVSDKPDPNLLALVCDCPDGLPRSTTFKLSHLFNHSGPRPAENLEQIHVENA